MSAQLPCLSSTAHVVCGLAGPLSRVARWHINCMEAGPCAGKSEAASALNSAQASAFFD